VASLRDAVFDIVATARQHWKEDREVYQIMKSRWSNQLVQFAGRDACLGLIREAGRHSWNHETDEVYRNLSEEELGVSTLYLLVARPRIIVL